MSLLQFYGLYTSQASLLRPKMIVQQLQIAFLLILAVMSIVAMSVGIEATKQVFGPFLKSALFGNYIHEYLHRLVTKWDLSASYNTLIV